MNETSYADRARAESFGAIADEYDQYRPSYPDALIADLAALNPRRVLDIATGTGKVAVGLVACGMAVLGLEVDPAMAAVARRHGIIVDVGAFETWDAEGRTFDLITCGQGWHWIDPSRGIPKAAELLNPGGTLALFWNYDRVEDEVQAAFDEVYGKHAPHLEHDPTSAKEVRSRYVEPLESSALFAEVETRKYRWERTYTSDEWVGRAATHSDHIQLPEDKRTALLAALREAIDQHGGSVAAHFTTFAIFARVAD